MTIFSVADVARPARQKGATLIEFTLVALPLLLLGALVFEAAYWHMTRQIAYVALLDSARAGATHPYRAEAMQRAFPEAFLPRFAAAHGEARQRQSDAWARIQSRTGMLAWRIEILPPDDADVLHTRLTYLHEPLSPVLRAVVRAMGQPHGDCTRKAWAHGMLPIRLTLDIETHVRRSTKATGTHENVVYGEGDCTRAAI